MLETFSSLKIMLASLLTLQALDPTLMSNFHQYFNFIDMELASMIVPTLTIRFWLLNLKSNWNQTQFYIIQVKFSGLITQAFHPKLSLKWLKVSLMKKSHSKVLSRQVLARCWLSSTDNPKMLTLGTDQPCWESSLIQLLEGKSSMKDTSKELKMWLELLSKSSKGRLQHDHDEYD